MAKKFAGRYNLVSVEQLKHQQLMTKRATSKLVYYQSVIRRDRALISILKEELYKAGGCEVPHLKLANYRLKRLDNQSDDIMCAIDSEEDKLYREYVEQHLRMTNYPEELMSPQANRSRPTRHFFSSPETSNYSKTSPAKSVTPEKRTTVKLEKVSVSKKLDEEVKTSVKVEVPIVTKKRQIAMKSTRGNVPRKKPRPANGTSSASTASTSSLADVKVKLEHSIFSTSYEQDLIAKAELEGKAFEELRAKIMCSSDVMKKDRANVSAKMVNGERLKALTGIKRKSDFQSIDRRKPNIKKVPRELIDDDYIPEDFTKSQFNADVSKDMKVRDDDLFDIFEEIRSEMIHRTADEDEYPIPGSLQKEVAKFVEDVTHLERAIFNTGSGDECSVLLESQNSKKHNGPYRDHFITILYGRFLATHRQSCSMEVFAQCLPRNMVRKTALGRGFCGCLSCSTAEIMYDNLVSLNIIDINRDFEEILYDEERRADVYSSLECVTDLDRNISTLTWVKNFKGNFSRSIKSVDETVGDLVGSFRQELVRLDDHLDNINVKYCMMRAALKSSEINQGEAMIHITWCDHPKVYRKSPSGHTMVDQSISMLSGYVWMPNNEYSFVCFSDQRDKSSPSLWAHLQEPLTDIINLGFTKLFIISDPPIHLFRNKAHFYHMNEFAVKHGVELRWFFSASCHTYFSADVSGLKVKEIIEKKTAAMVKSMGDNPYVRSEDIIDFLRDQIDTLFYLVKKDDVDRNVASLPNLQSIRGTPTFAEVLIGAGKFYVKLDSAEEYWTKVIVVF